MTPIRILDTAWVASAPEALFDAMTDFGRFPEWWPKHYKVRVEVNLETIEGREISLHPAPGFRIGWRLQSAERPHRFRLMYWRSWHTGHGLWKFEPEGQGTRVSYYIDILPKGRWYALFYKIINLPKRHSHDIQMIIGLLAERVGAPAPTDCTSKLIDS